MACADVCGCVIVVLVGGCVVVRVCVCLRTCLYNLFVRLRYIERRQTIHLALHVLYAVCDCAPAAIFSNYPHEQASYLTGFR